MSARDILLGLRSLLAFHKQLGIDSYPAEREVQQFLSLRPGKVVGQQAPAVASRPQNPDSKQRRDAEPPAMSLGPAVTLADIGEEVANCHACELHRQRTQAVPGRGPEQARLVVVGDWLMPEAKETLRDNAVFAGQQQIMLDRMLKAMGMDPVQVYLTNIIKCGLPEGCQPHSAQVTTCLSHLRRELQVLQPEYLLAMGMVTAKTLLGQTQPLSRLRGRFYPLTLPGGHRVEVVATYHPTYLLRNPELKGATWTDLQMLARKMGLTPVS